MLALWEALELWGRGEKGPRSFKVEFPVTQRLRAQRICDFSKITYLSLLYQNLWLESYTYYMDYLI